MLFLLHILHLHSSPHPPFHSRAFYWQPRLSAMPFGGSVLHFACIPLRHVTVQWLQDLLSSNYMLMIIKLFKVRCENLVLLQGLAMGWGVCVGLRWGIQPSIIWSHEGMDFAFTVAWESFRKSLVHFKVRKKSCIFTGCYIFAQFLSITSSAW